MRLSALPIPQIMPIVEPVTKHFPLWKFALT